MQNTKTDAVTTAVTACALSSHYEAMFRSLRSPRSLPHEDKDQPISKALYFHLAKVKYVGWKHRVAFHRARKHSIADVFHDLVAFYLRCALSERGLELVLEPSLVGKDGKRLHPDILVRKRGENICVIEVKTTIGFARPDAKAIDKYLALRERLEHVAYAAGLPVANCFYIFEEPTNVSAEFRDVFWDRKLSRAMPRDGLPFPLSQIYPLFWGTDPYYWTWPTAKDKSQWCPDVSDEVLLSEAEHRIVTPLEDVMVRIVKMEQELIRNRPLSPTEFPASSPDMSTDTQLQSTRSSCR
jgi:hypothetical protein